jgi:hypothetical protein
MSDGSTPAVAGAAGDEPWQNLGESMWARVQVCGRVRVEVDGVRRDESLIAVLWPDDPPAAVEAAVDALLSKLRRVPPCADTRALHAELASGGC